MFRISNILRRSPHPVYELVDLRGEPIDGQFYTEELISVNLRRRTESLVDKILDSRVRIFIRERIVRWGGYDPPSTAWCQPLTSVQCHFQWGLSASKGLYNYRAYLQTLFT